jgi:four helix bundle protein
VLSAEGSGGGVTRFEDLVAWKKARVLTVEVYGATRNSRFQNDHGLSRQVQRAAVSIMANIAEGFERNRPAEFHQFLSIAKSSCAELRSHLYVALDVGYLEPSNFDVLRAHAEEVGRVIGGLRAAVARRGKPGGN